MFSSSEPPARKRHGATILVIVLSTLYTTVSLANLLVALFSCSDYRYHLGLHSDIMNSQPANILLRVKHAYSKLLLNTYHLNFFNSCIGKGVIPKGLSVSHNLAYNVNNPALISEWSSILCEASSRNLDSIRDSYSLAREELVRDLDVLRAQASVDLGERNFNREYLRIKLFWRMVSSSGPFMVR